MNDVESARDGLGAEWLGIDPVLLVVHAGRDQDRAILADMALVFAHRTQSSDPRLTVRLSGAFEGRQESNARQDAGLFGEPLQIAVCLPMMRVVGPTARHGRAEVHRVA